MKNIITITILGLLLVFKLQAQDDNEVPVPLASKTSGFYTESFTVEISSPANYTSVIYTIDGSDPEHSSTALIVQIPVSVAIDPVASNRPNTPVFLLRVCGFDNDEVLTHSVTYSYIFINKVLTQSYPGAPWPEADEKINDQVFDYDMDNEIVEHADYKDRVKPSMLSIPSISLVTDMNSLIQPDSGIWVNALEHGIEWERAASFEIIDTDGTSAIKSNCGIRIRGGSSRKANNAKHALRLFFRDEYGAKKLDYPLFGDEGADEFDNIDLRTSQNYAWSRQSSSGAYNTMNRDVFSRDLQKQMGSPYTRSRYYHLYLNGMYWGIYMTQERAEADYAETYFGGDEEDYDVVKVFNDDRTIEATDGTLDVWNEIWEMTKEGFVDNDNYTRIMGLDAQGNINAQGTKYVDAENLIDYLMIIFFTGNFDAPTNVWSENKGAKNFFAIKNRARNRDGFVFFEHDAEHSLFYDAISVGSGIVENRVNIGFLEGDMQMDVTEFKFFQPQFLHHKLMENSEYRQLFIDRVYKWFYKEKVLQKGNAQAMFSMRTSQIDQAIIAESARWGDRKVSTPRTRDDDWLAAVDQIMNDYFSERPQIVLNQIKEVDWYTSFDAPDFYFNSSKTESSYIHLSANDNLRITNPSNVGNIYYTTDGTDPRGFGGSISATALTNPEQVDMQIAGSKVIKARIKNGNEWSALNEITLLKNDDLSNLRINELHYNPLDQDSVGGKHLEFVEFKNMGSTALNLAGLSISGGIAYQFNTGTIIEPNAFVVLASNAIEFKEYYAIQPTGEYQGHLSNSGDSLIIMQDDKELVSLFYSTNSPWPAEADGLGNSLVYDETNSDMLPNDANYWRASYQLNGTPFSDDFEDEENSVVSNRIVTELSIFPNPASSHINITFKSNESGHVNIRLLNIVGQEVMPTKYENAVRVGLNSKFINLKDHNLKAGIYIFQLFINGGIENRKIIVE